MIGRYTLLLTLILLLPGSVAARKAYAAPLERPNVLLIVVDTMAARHLGVYDSKLQHTPNLKSFADAATTFTRAYSAAPWTKPSLASIFTSLYPSEHLVKRLEATLDPKFETVAERLTSAGYDSHGVISHTLIQDKFGYAQGFRGYELVNFKGNVHDSVTSQEVHKLALEWLDKGRVKEKPFFLFLHYFDPHFNYQHHEDLSLTTGYSGPLNPGIGFRALRAKLPKLAPTDIGYLRNLYREEISYTDRYLGKLFVALRERKLSENTLIIITADHGEEFMEHGSIGHTRTLYDELINVPLIISWPGNAQPQRIELPVSTIDIMPTILDAVGMARPDTVRGISLLPTVRAKTPPPLRPLFSEVDFTSSQVNAHMLGVILGEKKAMIDYRAKSREAVDLAVDPMEQKGSSIIPKELEAELEKFSSASTGSSAEELPSSPEELEQLKSLGYL